MNIVFDLDNTMFHNDIVDNACADNGLERTSRHDLTDLPQHVQERCWAEFKDANIMGSFKPLKGAEGLDVFLEKQGHTIYVVTARSLSLKDATVEMVKRHFPAIKEENILLVESYSKGEVYEQIKADVVLDDHALHIHQAIDVGVPHAVLISNDKTRYNHHAIAEVEERGALVASNISIVRGIVDGE